MPPKLCVPLSWAHPETIAKHHHERGYMVLNDSKAAEGEQPTLTDAALQCRVFANLTLGQLSGLEGDISTPKIDFGTVCDASGETLEQRIGLWWSQLGTGDHTPITLSDLVELVAFTGMPCRYGPDVLRFVLVRVLGKVSDTNASRETCSSSSKLESLGDLELIEDVLRHVDLVGSLDDSGPTAVFWSPAAVSSSVSSRDVRPNQSVSQTDHVLSQALSDARQQPSTEEHTTTTTFHNLVTEHVRAVLAQLQEAGRADRASLYAQLVESINNSLTQVQQSAHEDLAVAVGRISEDVNAALAELQQAGRRELDAHRAEVGEALSRTGEAMEQIVRLVTRLQMLVRDEREEEEEARSSAETAD